MRLPSVIIFSLILFSASLVSAQTILGGARGGTGIGSTGAGNIGNCLQVLSVTPLSYTYAACSGGAGGGAGFGNTWQFPTGITDAITPTTTVGIIVNASSSITRLSVTSATTTQATTTSLSATTASTTNLFISSTGNGSSQCLQVSGIGLVSGFGAGCISLSTANTWTAKQTYNTQTDFLGPLVIGTSTASTTIWGNTATSSFGSGIDLAGGGCFSINGTCLSTLDSQQADFKAAVNYTSTSSLVANNYANGSAGVGATLTEVGLGALYVDGANPSVGQRILVKNETDATHNGIYTVTVAGSGIAAYVLTRSTDYNSPNDVYAGTAAYVISGTNNAGTSWTMTTTGAITIGTSNLAFSELSVGALTAGTGITISGGTIGCITATGLVQGCLTAADWLTFNGKLGTSTTLGASQLLYSSGGSNVSSVATGTISGTNGVTVTANRYAIGGAATVDCTVASASAAGCLGTTNFLLFNNKVGTSTAGESAGQLAFFTSTNGTPALITGVATGTVSGASVISVTAGRAAVGGALAITTTPGTFGGATAYTFPQDLVITGNATSAILAVTNIASTSILTVTSQTSTSSAMLFSIGSTTPESTCLFCVGTSSSRLTVSKKTSFVGIASSTPTAPLSISGAGTVVAISGDLGNDPELDINANGSGGSLRIGVASNGHIVAGALNGSGVITNDRGALHFGTAASSPSSIRMTIDATGLVGVGSTSPGTILTVGPVVANGSTTISMGKLQFDGYNTVGTRECAYIVGTAWVIQAGACR